MVYPNPATHFLKLNLPNGNSGTTQPLDYKIIGINGQIYQDGQFSFDGAIDLNTLSSGVYWLRLTNHKPVKFIKF